MTTIEFLSDGPEDAALTVALAHGAGAPMDSPFLNFFADGLVAQGYRVARFEFPYMAARRVGGKARPPDRANILLDTWRGVIDVLGPERLVIGGKSLGGRMASMIADTMAVRGLICLGYPFHPPGQPDKLRTSHLETLRTPALFLQGTRDPFGGQAEVAGYALVAGHPVWIGWRMAIMALRHASPPAAPTCRTGSRRSPRSAPF